MDTDESSDNEPLNKVAKMTAKTVKKPVSVPVKKSVDTKKKGNFLSMEDKITVFVVDSVIKIFLTQNQWMMIVQMMSH